MDDKNEKRTEEYRISNRRISKDGIAALCFHYNRQNSFLLHSKFIIRYSTFAFAVSIQMFMIIAYFNYPKFQQYIPQLYPAPCPSPPG